MAALAPVMVAPVKGTVRIEARAAMAPAVAHTTRATLSASMPASFDASRLSATARMAKP